jgi:hypothetical protein
MIFLPEQVAEYDKQRAQFAQAPQMELFVSDERSAIDWLTDFLRKRPSTYQEVHPQFITQLGAGWRKHEQKPELGALLEDNFLRYDGAGDVPTQISNYLSKNFHDYRGWTSATRGWSPRPRNAGTSRTRTRRGTWRRSARRRF